MEVTERWQLGPEKGTDGTGLPPQFPHATHSFQLPRLLNRGGNSQYSARKTKAQKTKVAQVASRQRQQDPVDTGSEDKRPKFKLGVVSQSCDSQLLRRLRQEDHEFQASLGSSVRKYLKILKRDGGKEAIK